MSNTTLELLDQIATEVNTLIRVNKKGDYQCTICGRRAPNTAAIDHTDACNWKKLTELSKKLRAELEQSQ